MPNDRYAPPEAPLVDEAALLAEAGGEFEVGRALSDAWTVCWANFPLWLGVSFVGMLLTGLSVFIPPVLGLLLFAPVIGWGLTCFLLNMMDGRASFGDLFAGFAQYGTALFSIIMVVLVVSLIGLVGQSIYLIGVAADNWPLTVFGYVLNLAWSLFLVARLHFSWFFMVDRGLGPIEALQASWDITSGQTLKVASLIMVGGLVAVAGVLALLVGVIPAIMIFYLMWASAYRQMVGGSARTELGGRPLAAPAS